MIIIAVVIYSFMAGMMSGWIHTKLKDCAIFWGCLWPVTLWRMIA
ncbi:hypothetical protein ACWWJF_15740 [Symbiopectobacterium sp. Eva_TO]